jgi:hypothetical protein
MPLILTTRFEVVYYDDGRQLYWPADNRSDVLADKLRECRAAGHGNARIAQVGCGG